ncbi:MAG: hypothetical protein ACYTG0_38575 [Planctomycetota bacterium]|jgi:hypothetical protein
MPGTEGAWVYQLVVDGFRALGAADSESVRKTFLLRENDFLGEKYQCDGMQAVWLVGEDTVRFYDEHGTLLNTTTLDEQQTKKAA